MLGTQLINYISIFPYSILTQKCYLKQKGQNRKCTYNYTECLSHNMKRSDLFNKQLNIEYILKLCFVRLRDKYLPNLIWIIFSSAEII